KGQKKGWQHRRLPPESHKPVMYRLFRRQIQASARRRGCLASLEGFQNPSKGGEKSPGGDGRLCIRRPGELPWKCAAFSTSLRYFPEELCVRLMAPRISHNSNVGGLKAEQGPVLKGHGFSRAATRPKPGLALGPEAG